MWEKILKRITKTKVAVKKDDGAKKEVGVKKEASVSLAMQPWWDSKIVSATVVQATGPPRRAYIVANHNGQTDTKKKLIIEVNEKQSKGFSEIVQTIMGEIGNTGITKHMARAMKDELIEG